MNTLPLNTLPLTHSKQLLALFMQGATCALFGLLLASRFFAEARELGAAALIALGLGPALAALLAQNRQEIWEHRIHPAIANRRFATAMLVLFLSVLSVAALLARLTPEVPTPTELSTRYRSSFETLFEHNLAVLIAGSFLAALYRANGLMLLLAYNAAYWGVSFSDYCFVAASAHGMWYGISLLISLLPHAIMEVLSYVLAGMAGTFISLAITRYSLSSPEFRRVSRACGLLLILSILSLVMATSLEISLGQSVFRSIIG